MKTFIRFKESTKRGPARLAALTLAAAVVVAGAAGILAGRADAGPSRAAGNASYLHQQAKFEPPTLRHGVLKIRGSRAGDRIVLRLQAGEPDVLQLDVGDDGAADFEFDRAEVARIVVDARAGYDLVRIDESNGVFTDSIPTAIRGGEGRDTLAGGSGRETFRGGRGNDSIDGNRGNDLAFMGAGHDTFVWDPGDGSDTVEGKSGYDTMLFNGADGAEQVDLSANGNRLKFFRDVGNITMDTNDVERVNFQALGGADLVTVNNLRRTDLGKLNVDLGVNGDGDGQPDRVVVNGTYRRDRITVSGDSSGVSVSGLRTLVAIRHQEPSDELAVDGLGGNDVISATALAVQAVALILDGDAGYDTIGGGRGIETLLGGRGNDSIDGNAGNDLALLGAGNDTFVWDPGDGSDTVEGESGYDTMLFNGADGAEQIDLSANGNRLRFFRDVGNITMDTNDVERVNFQALGGADTTTVNDLSGTDVDDVNVDLEGTPGNGDGQPDRVVVNATNGDDAITVNGGAAGVQVRGLSATVRALHSEVANDRLEINTLAGVDTVDPAGLAAGVIQLFVDGVPVP
jgi:Ca2+-binding RTX toxin-like protein